jgi:hypothetical protein
MAGLSAILNAAHFPPFPEEQSIGIIDYFSKEISNRYVKNLL